MGEQHTMTTDVDSLGGLTYMHYCFPSTGDRLNKSTPKPDSLMVVWDSVLDRG